MCLSVVGFGVGWITCGTNAAKRRSRVSRRRPRQGKKEGGRPGRSRRCRKSGGRVGREKRRSEARPGSRSRVDHTQRAFPGKSERRAPDRVGTETAGRRRKVSERRVGRRHLRPPPPPSTLSLILPCPRLAQRLFHSIPTINTPSHDPHSTFHTPRDHSSTLFELPALLANSIPFWWERERE